MERFKLAITIMAVTDSQWGTGDAQGRRREFTAEDLDALAHWGWHLPKFTGAMAACARLMAVNPAAVRTAPDPPVVATVS